MKPARRWWCHALPLLALGFCLLSLSPAQQPALPKPAPSIWPPTSPMTPLSRTPPRPEAVAETRLLMEGLALPNFKGMDRLLRQKPTETDQWVFLRGQALLIAETGNLLMMRPPRTGGQDAWSAHAAELRDAATRLARSAAERDYERSRSGIVEVANVCNRCHQTFRVTVRMPPKDSDK